MKKFEVILIDPVTGYDKYPSTRLGARSFAELAIALENCGVSFRCINDVTKNYVPDGCVFVSDPFPAGKAVAA